MLYNCMMNCYFILLKNDLKKYLRQYDKIGIDCDYDKSDYDENEVSDWF